MSTVFSGNVTFKLDPEFDLVIELLGTSTDVAVLPAAPATVTVTDERGLSVQFRRTTAMVGVGPAVSRRSASTPRTEAKTFRVGLTLRTGATARVRASLSQLTQVDSEPCDPVKSGTPFRGGNPRRWRFPNRADAPLQPARSPKVR